MPCASPLCNQSGVGCLLARRGPALRTVERISLLYSSNMTELGQGSPRNGICPAFLRRTCLLCILCPVPSALIAALVWLLCSAKQSVVRRASCRGMRRDVR